MPFWGRRDGDLVRDVPAYRRIMPHIMRGRNESAVFFEQRIDAQAALAFVDEWNASGKTKISFFHLLVWALVQTFHERPRLNRFTRGGRLYQRRGFWLSYSAKKRLDDASPVVVIKQRFAPGKSFEELVQAIAMGVEVGRSDKPSSVDNELALVLRLPEPILSLAVRMMMWLDKWNLLPHAFVRSDPMYASVFLANLGSLKMDAAYHHLYEYGTIPIFGTIGRFEDVLVSDGQGGARTKRQIVLKWTFDERVEDGLYCVRALDRLQELVETLDGIKCDEPRLEPVVAR